MSQGNPDAGQHLVHTKGLRNIIISPQVKRFNFVVFGIFHREDDNWQLLSPGIVPFLIKKSIGQKRSTNGLGCRQNALDMLKEVL